MAAFDELHLGSAIRGRCAVLTTALTVLAAASLTIGSAPCTRSTIGNKLKGGQKELPCSCCTPSARTRSCNQRGSCLASCALCPRSSWWPQRDPNAAVQLTCRSTIWPHLTTPCCVCVCATCCQPSTKSSLCVLLRVRVPRIGTCNVCEQAAAHCIQGGCATRSRSSPPPRDTHGW